MKRIVVIGDIVSSRTIPDRGLIQGELQRVLKQLNERDSQIISPYTVTLGDEFQAVFNNADSLFSDAVSILLTLYPVRVRFSFGIGTIETPINRQQALGMDGVAFYNARQGIEKLKGTSCLFRITGVENRQLSLVQQALCLISHAVVRWKRPRLQVLSMLYVSSSVKEIAAELQVTDKAVYKTIEAGALRVVLQLLQDITAYLNESLTGSRADGDLVQK